MTENPANVDNKHRRPCYYAKKIGDYFWLIPISSKVEKYTRIYEEKKLRYSTYDGIKFGYVNGQKRAFLIQNIFPITENFAGEVYKVNGGTVPATVNKKTAETLSKAAEKVVRLNERGVKISITDINKILKELEA